MERTQLGRWLHHLNTRGGTIAILTDGTVHLDITPPTGYDDWAVLHYGWALTQAVDPRWATWWAWITGHTTTRPSIHDVPSIPTNLCADGTIWGCARCGQPAWPIDAATMLAWCPEHSEPAPYQTWIPTTGPFVDWLADLRRRGGVLVTSSGRVHLTQTSPTSDDAAMLATHQAALLAGASGLYPLWWARVTGKPVPDTWDPGDDPSWLPCITLPGGRLELACAQCGGPAATIDATTWLHWCADHRPPYWDAPALGRGEAEAEGTPQPAPAEIALFAQGDAT